MDANIFMRELSGDEWICPNVTSITLNNDPSVYQAGNGTGFFLTVNDCVTA